MNDATPGTVSLHCRHCRTLLATLRNEEERVASAIRDGMWCATCEKTAPVSTFRQSTERDARKLPVSPRDESDDVSIEELQKAVEHMHGVPARFLEAVEVDERFKGDVVWQGTVKVFALDKHPSGATRAYAWSYLVEGTRRKFKAVLGLPPVDGPVMAVRASILAEQAKAKN